MNKQIYTFVFEPVYLVIAHCFARHFRDRFRSLLLSRNWLPFEWNIKPFKSIASFSIPFVILMGIFDRPCLGQLTGSSHVLEISINSENRGGRFFDPCWDKTSRQNVDPAITYYSTVALLLARANSFRIGDIDLVDGKLKTDLWADVPLNQFPSDKCTAYVDRFADFTDMLQSVSATSDCGWLATAPDREEIAVSELYRLGMILNLKCRVKISEGNYADAYLTLRTMCILSSHLRTGPSSSHVLCGLRLANAALSRIREIVELGGPNCYWVLSSLSVNAKSLRTLLCSEVSLIEKLFPDIESLRNEFRHDYQVGRLETVVDAWLMKRGHQLVKESRNSAVQYILKNLKDMSVSQMRDTALSDFEIAVGAKSRAIAGLMQNAEAKLNLPWSEAFNSFPQELAKIDKELVELDSVLTNGKVLFTYLPNSELPSASIGRALTRSVQVERLIALLLYVESVRYNLLMKANDANVELGQITFLPRPLDPGTGQPIELQSLDNGYELMVPTIPESEIVEVKLQINTNR